jgi:lipoyl(octanoyl) transferase
MSLRVIDLGRIGYQAAYQMQVMHLEEVLASRDAGQAEIGRILLLEHDPVITIGRHPRSARHVLATREMLAVRGVEVVESDRGGDVTYHGPGQLVVYPIVDLNRLNLGLHAYMRLLEAAVIQACSAFGLDARREPGATGVWVEREGGSAKLGAMGVRVRRWATMHGLAINVGADLSNFDLIVPCGLAGRSVTSLRALLGQDAPTMERVKEEVSRRLTESLSSAARGADTARRQATGVHGISSDADAIRSATHGRPL